MKVLKTALLGLLFGAASLSAQASDNVSWSVSFGSPGYYAPPVRHYRAPATAYYGAPVVYYRAAPQVVYLPHGGYYTTYEQHDYGYRDGRRHGFSGGHYRSQGRGHHHGHHGWR